jgi:hypothetical protein
VTIAGKAATEIDVVSSTEISCKTPANDAGMADVEVTQSSGSDKLTDGFEYKDVPVKTQDVSLSPASTGADVDDAITLSVNYSTSDDGKAFGVGLRFHYDSSKLMFTEFADVNQSPPPTLNDPEPKDDSDNYDDDQSTDKYILLAWSNTSASWPYTTMPVKLADLLFSAISEGNAHVKISFSSLSDGYTGKAENAIIEIGSVPPTYHSADYNPQDNRINLSELLRVIQIYNFTGTYYCKEGTEDGYMPGYGEDKNCGYHSSDYEHVFTAPGEGESTIEPDWSIDHSELQRIIQLYNFGCYIYDASTEDHFKPVECE